MLESVANCLQSDCNLWQTIADKFLHQLHNRITVNMQIECYNFLNGWSGSNIKFNKKFKKKLKFKILKIITNISGKIFLYRIFLIRICYIIFYFLHFELNNFIWSFYVFSSSCLFYLSFFIQKFVYAFEKKISPREFSHPTRCKKTYFLAIIKTRIALHRMLCLLSIKNAF